MNLIKLAIDYFSSLSLSEIVSYSIGLFGILLTVFFYYKSKQTHEPRFKKLSSVITDDMISQKSLVRIQYKGRNLARLSISKIAIWNTGITLKKEEISQKCPFRIELLDDNTQILDCKMCYSEEENDVSCFISSDKKNIEISFDYLAKNQGFVVKILHTGLGSSSLAVKGALRSEKTLKQSTSFLSFISSRLLGNIHFSLFKAIMGYIYLFSGILLLIYPFFHYGEKVEAKTIGFNEVCTEFFIGIVLIIIGLLLNRREMPKKISKAFYNE